MTEILPSDAFVFFGATGDLAFKKIFPALQALARRGRLDMPPSSSSLPGFNMSMAITAMMQHSSTCARHWRALSDHCIIWRFRPVCLRPSYKALTNVGAQQMHVSSSKNPSAATSLRRKHWIT